MLSSIALSLCGWEREKYTTNVLD